MKTCVLARLKRLETVRAVLLMGGNSSGKLRGRRSHRTSGDLGHPCSSVGGEGEFAEALHTRRVLAVTVR
jgi:hypothetical protein